MLPQRLPLPDRVLAKHRLQKRRFALTVFPRPNHYLASGDRQRARELYLKAIAADPHHVNANLQLAQMSVEERLGSEALAYLNRLEDAANSDVAALLVRAQAMALTGLCADAGRLLESLEGQAGCRVRLRNGAKKPTYCKRPT